MKCKCEYIVLDFGEVCPVCNGLGEGSPAPSCSAFSVKLALELSSFVHERCKDVPHDIGIHLATIAAKHLKQNSPGQPPKVG